MKLFRRYFIQKKLPCFFFLAITLSNTPELLAKEPAKIIENPPEPANLIESSTIFADHKYWTIVPKQAVLFIPDTLKSKVVSAPKGKFVTFQKFLTYNGSWLHSYPIDLQYARGQKRFTQNRFDQLCRMNKIVVSTYQRGPITLHPNAYPPVEEETDLKN